MNKIAFLGSFRTRVTLTLIIALLLMTALSTILVGKFALDAQFNQLREKLMIIAQTSALMIDSSLLSQVPLSREGVNSAQYKEIAAVMRKIKQANPLIKYIYSMAPTDRPDVWQYIVDPDPVLEPTKNTGPTSYPGDPYDPTRCPEIYKALDAPSADMQFTIDEWGVFLSGYAPIRNKDGKTIAVLGVDMLAGDVHRIQREVYKRVALLFAVGVLISVGLGFYTSRWITGPVAALVAGTRHLARGDLQHQVEVNASDELGELARSFNEMATSLFESRERLHAYFYEVMQSLVRILEAQDVYTRGHSERVAAYAEKIACQMGFSPERVELLREVALLHDIGKLGIQKNILNKESPLTPEEWKSIHEHPMIGEEILKPVAVDPEILAIVRSHHERYDGVGYPDKIDGKHTNIFAQIIAIADAYDAMTSARAYRPAMTKEKAIEELKKKSGTQFNPLVVQAFLTMAQGERDA
ncbi:MAG: HD domain-containing protein [Candidatus Aureabacteria bacterium]|nr:HD domain-containing protein [Candidatus Auribacterota bacterium]